MTERVHPWMSNTQGNTQPVAFLHGGGGGTPSPLLGRITSVNLAHTVDSIGSLNIFYKKAKVVSEEAHTKPKGSAIGTLVYRSVTRLFLGNDPQTQSKKAKRSQYGRLRVFV